MRFVLTVTLIVAVFLMQLGVIGLDVWQLAHFYRYSEWLMAMNCLVIPACAWNAWHLPKTMMSVIKTERRHRARMLQLNAELQRLDGLKQEYAEWFMREREAIIAHINSIEVKHPEHAALLRQRMAEAERIVYGNH